MYLFSNHYILSTDNVDNNSLQHVTVDIQDV
jgi:hypothetical protein